MQRKISETYLQNISTVLEYLYRTQETSRIEIANNTGLTPATITTIIGDLLEKEVVVETGAEMSASAGSGRKRKALRLNEKSGILLGVEVNLKGIFVVATNILGKVLSSSSILISSYLPEEINKTVIRLIEETLAPLEYSQIYGAGVAVPGHFDYQKNAIISNNQQWAHFNLLEIKKEFAFPFIAENNVTCMALGQYLFSPLQTPENFLFFHVGPGMFCSYFQATEIGFNDNYYIGEIGHTVVDIHGPNCECGKKGCLQTYISDTWLIKKARFLFNHSDNTALRSLVSDPADITLSTVINSYQLADPYLNQQIDLGLTLLSTSIANTMILLDAKKIYIHSELLSFKNFKEQLTENVKKQLSFIPTKRDTAIEIIPFDNHRGAKGACALAALSFFIQHDGYRQEVEI